MTREEIIEMANSCVDCDGDCMVCSNEYDVCCELEFAKFIVDKENEPAPAGTDTSSKNNNYQLNDSANLEICQEAIKDIINDLEDSEYSTDIVSVKNSNSKAVGGLKTLLNIIKSGDNK